MVRVSWILWQWVTSTMFHFISKVLCLNDMIYVYYVYHTDHVYFTLFYTCSYTKSIHWKVKQSAKYTAWTLISHHCHVLRLGFQPQKAFLDAVGKPQSDSVPNGRSRSTARNLSDIREYIYIYMYILYSLYIIICIFLDILYYLYIPAAPCMEDLPIKLA